MTSKTKENIKWHNSVRRTPRLQSCIKSAALKLALWGVVPVKVADWLIQQGGLARRGSRSPELYSNHWKVGRRISFFRGEAGSSLQNCGVGESL